MSIRNDSKLMVDKKGRGVNEAEGERFCAEIITNGYDADGVFARAWLY